VRVVQVVTFVVPQLSAHPLGSIDKYSRNVYEQQFLQ
jgi:hypothetical protein